MDVVFEKTSMADGTKVERIAFYDAVPTIALNALANATGEDERPMSNDKTKHVMDSLRKDLSRTRT